MVTSWPKLGLALPTSAKGDLYHARDGPNATEERGGVAADSTRNGRAAGRATRGSGESKRLRCLPHRSSHCRGGSRASQDAGHPGHQIVGRVDETAEGVTRLRVGRRIGIAWL